MNVRTIDVPTAFAATCRRFEELLAERRSLIDRLNVFPVPDGDTGSNMFLTARSVTLALDGLDVDAIELSTLCRELSMAALLGARGNSGVILSQLLQGFASVVAERGANVTHVGELVDLLAAALTSASELANKAVLRPKEGTILTVASDVARVATAFTGDGGLDDFFLSILFEARQSLLRTPTLLEALASAGVVDSGGAGFVHFIEALWFGFAEGTPRDEFAEYPWYEHAAQLGGAVVADLSEVREEIIDEELRYEVMYLLRARSDAAVNGMKDVWAGLGDSIVVVGQEGVWNCHLHTNDIGAAIEAGIAAGDLSNIRVTDLRDQVAEEQWVRSSQAGPERAAEAMEFQETAVVAVSNGDGVARIFHSLGVSHIVVGGQTMNPSTSDLLEAVARCNANGVILLPNNSNIIAVGDAVARLAEVPVAVVPTTSVVEGFSALLEFDPSSPFASNAQSMTESAARVRTGEVTTAVRDGAEGSITFQTGDYLGLGPDGIVCAGRDLVEVAVGLLEALLSEGGEIVTLVEGEGATSHSTRELMAQMAERHGEVTIESHVGGQALYPYLFGVE
jgi:DAK2 domain fusion protein YloV